ncbi:MAG: hypothetical protein ABR599_08060 [Gemmatimonadota bacterium]
MRNYLSENLAFKIVAIVVALVLWFGVKTDRQAEVRFPVPVEVVTESDEETVLGGVPARVDVTFAGAGKDLLRLGDQHYRLRKVLDPGRAGPRRVRISPEDVLGTGNLNVRPVGVLPNVLTLNVDHVVSKRVPLRSYGELEAAEGYVVDGPVRFEPPSVTLIGARTILADIDTLPVDVSRLRGEPDGLERVLRLRIPEHPSIVVQPDSVRIVADVQEASRRTARLTGVP